MGQRHDLALRSKNPVDGGLLDRWRNSQMVCHRPEGGVHPFERGARSGLRFVGRLG